MRNIKEYFSENGFEPPFTKYKDFSFKILLHDTKDSMDIIVEDWDKFEGEEYMINFLLNVDMILYRLIKTKRLTSDRISVKFCEEKKPLKNPTKDHDHGRRVYNMVRTKKDVLMDWRKSKGSEMKTENYSFKFPNWDLVDRIKPVDMSNRKIKVVDSLERMVN